MGELQVETHTKRLLVDNEGRRWEDAVTMAAVHFKETSPALDDVEMGTVTWLLSLGRSRLIRALAEVEAGQRLLAEGNVTVRVTATEPPDLVQRIVEVESSERPSPAQRKLDPVYDRGQVHQPGEPEPELRKTWPGEGCALDARQADLLRRSHARQAETIENLRRENGLKASRIAALEADLAGAAATNVSLDKLLRERDMGVASLETDLRSQLDINRGLEEANRELMQRSGGITITNGDPELLRVLSDTRTALFTALARLDTYRQWVQQGYASSQALLEEETGLRQVDAAAAEVLRRQYAETQVITDLPVEAMGAAGIPPLVGTEIPEPMSPRPRPPRRWNSG